MRALAFISLIAMGCQGSPGQDEESVKAWVRSEFPDVAQIAPAELKARLDEGGPEAPLLLDVREEDEYAVSHLPGAVRVEPGTAGGDAVAGLDPETPIVAYCSVGYRSSELVERLREKGFTNVANLEGSIFAWANEGYPVERDGREVRQVHPFDEEWGRLLDRSLHAYEPRE